MSAASPVARAFAIVWALQGRSFDGIRLKTLATLVDQLPSTTLRDLESLAEQGVAERMPNDKDCWRLSPKLVQVAIAHHSELARLQQQVADFTNRFSRNPN